jgi:tRNA A37 N6-isopentenylltransferase MiaA
MTFATRQRAWVRSEPGIRWIDAASDPLPNAQAAIRDVAGLAQA